MSQTVLQVQVRTDTGKQVAKRLRRNGMIPGVYYIRGEQAVPLAVDVKHLRSTLARKSSIIDVGFNNGESSKCIVREVQWDPLKSTPLHIDLMGVKLTEKVTVEVSIQIVGSAVGVKNGGILQQLLRELEIECLPLDIPEKITVDVSALDIHDAIHVADLKLDKIEILVDPDQVIVSVLPPRLEETPAAAPGEEAKEPELIGRAKEEEGEEGAGKKEGSGKKEEGGKK